MGELEGGVYGRVYENHRNFARYLDVSRFLSRVFLKGFS